MTLAITLTPMVKLKMLKYKKCFFKAAEVLSEILSATVIDDHPVDSQTVATGQEFVPEEPDAKWVSKHVRQSRYTLQIVKCKDEACCEPYKTSLLDAILEQSIPFPAIYQFESNGPVAVELYLVVCHRYWPSAA